MDLIELNRMCEEFKITYVIYRLTSYIQRTVIDVG